MLERNMLSIECYSVTISVRSSVDIVISNGIHISEAQEIVEDLINLSDDYNRKIELVRIKTLLRYAACSGAMLEKMENEDSKIIVTMSFRSLDRMDRFCKDITQKINDNTTN